MVGFFVLFYVATAVLFDNDVGTDSTMCQVSIACIIQCLI